MTTLAIIAVLLFLAPSSASALHARGLVDDVARALGAAGVTSIEMTASGVTHAVGQSPAPGAPWPRFTVTTFTRAVNYETATLRDELVRRQAEDPPRGGGNQPLVGERSQIFVVNGDHAWNVVGDDAIPAPLALADRQLQLWSTPHGVVRAARANRGVVSGRTIAFTVPGRFTARAVVDERNLIERVDATLPHPVLGDMTVQVRYADYRDFGGVMFPTRIRQTADGLPTLDVTVTDVRANAAVSAPVPDAVRQTTRFYARVASQMVADGVWYLTGGTHHSVAIEMEDYVIVVEAPLNDERALAVIAEVRSHVGDKPIRYVINTHHHFDHAGGLRAFAAEGVTVITHDTNRAFFERTLTVPATVLADHLTTTKAKPVVEAVRDRRVLTDGTRVVEIHHLAGNLHHDGLLVVYLPKEKLVIQADAYTPAAENAAAPPAVNPFSVNLADTIARRGLAVDRLLPLHGDMVPIAELHRAIGRVR